MNVCSMEEAEALCDRVGILVNGHLHCVGPPAQLKSDIGNNMIDSKTHSTCHKALTHTNTLVHTQATS